MLPEQDTAVGDLIGLTALASSDSNYDRLELGGETGGVGDTMAVFFRKVSSGLQWSGSGDEVVKHAPDDGVVDARP